MNRWLICAVCVFSDRLVGMEELTKKQKKFVDAYLTNNGNCAAAYRDAGYAFKNENSLMSASSALLRNLKVQRHMNKAMVKVQKQSEKSVDITREFLIGKYLQIIEGALSLEKPHYGSAKAGLDSLANITGHWQDRRLEISGNVSHVMAELSPNELLELIGRRSNVIEGNSKVIEGADSEDSI